MGPRRYRHGGRVVEAMRFVGNGPEIAGWCGARTEGAGLSGSLRVGGRLVACGDWVVRAGSVIDVVDQAIFAMRYEEVRHAHVE